MKNLDLLTIGDSSVDLFLKVPNSATNIEEANAKMCFIHGSKVMVESFSTSISGNALNVAVGAQLLGLNTSVYTETGDDDNAERTVNELNKLGVDTSLVMKNPKTETALHAVIVYAQERTIFSYHGKHNYKIREWGKPKFIYYTSLGEGFEKFQAELIEFINQNSDIGLAVNPGTFQMAQGLNSLKNIFAVTDVLFVNKEEAQVLTKTPHTDDLLTLHKKILDLGIKLSVITDAENGASAYDGKELYTQTIYSDDKPIVDKTGAGDAFSAGFMSALIYGKKIEEALKWGVINSSYQIKSVGSISGMAKKVEIEKILSSGKI